MRPSAWFIALGVMSCAADPSAAPKAAKAKPTAKAPPVPEGPERPPATAEGGVAPTASADASVPTRFPAAKRLVAIGDVHGDLQAARAALQLAGAIDASDAWVGGDLVVVQTGDQLDRGNDEPEILALFQRLQKEAAAAGGTFHVLNGNHEYMNAAGDMRYVTPEGFQDYANAEGVDANDPTQRELPEPVRGRFVTFRPGGEGAKLLAERPAAIVVGDTVFAHGGITPRWAEYGLEKINAEARSWLLGARAEMPSALQAENGPVWSRAFSLDPDLNDCAELGRALETLGAKRMVVGHTVHREGVTRACDDQVWMVDVGMAKHYGGRPQVLEITSAGAKPIGP